MNQPVRLQAGSANLGRAEERGTAARRCPLESGLTSDEKRILNPRPWNHYRRTYSVAEVRIGVVVLAILAGVAGWVAWRGAHPDPRLFAVPTGGNAADAAKGAASLPPGLAPAGWTLGPASRFDPSNLYVKINGRADFFLSRGFRTMTFVSLSSSASPALLVDVELYDLASAENALSAFTGEKPPEVPAEGNGYILRNALFLARGETYVRALGSEESPAVTEALAHLRQALEAGIAAGEKPWSHAFFERALGVPGERVTFLEESAFSFAFASGVSVALLEDGVSEAFIMPAGDAAAAGRLARQFETAFLDYGEKVADGKDTWVKDRYLGGFSRAEGAGVFVVGVRGAADLAVAKTTLRRLVDEVTRRPPVVPAGTKDAAVPAGKGATGYE